MTVRIPFGDSLQLLEAFYHQPRLTAADAGLRRAEVLLRGIGDPHHSFRSVHVAGSSGKGSTTTMIGSILDAAGYDTGYFRSPHLRSYTERMSIGEHDIPAAEWETVFSRVWPVVEAMRKNDLPGYNLGRPALFEVLFAMAALYFARSGVTWAAVEAGLGGRLDATNLLPSDVAVITNVSLEHTRILGKTVSAIAAEKAAIIKRGSHAVTAAWSPEAIDVIQSRATTMEVPLLRVGKDVEFLVRSETLEGQRVELRHETTTIDLSLPLSGRFQAWNAATAFAACLALRERGVALPDSAIVKGLESVRIPGRMDVVSHNPTVVLDGAHNPAAAHELRISLQSLVGERSIILLFTAMADKDIPAMARELGPLADSVILTRVPESERSAGMEVLRRAFAPYGSDVHLVPDVDEALARLLSWPDPGALLVVTGSLYLVGYAGATLQSKVAAG